MSLKMPDVVAQMHELAAEMGVRLHRAGEQARKIIKPYAGPSAIVAKRETASGVDGPRAGASTVRYLGTLPAIEPARANCILLGGPSDGLRLQLSPETDAFVHHRDPGCFGWNYKRTTHRTFDGLSVFEFEDARPASQPGDGPRGVSGHSGPVGVMSSDPDDWAAWDPAALRKVLRGFGHSAVEVERRVHQSRIDAAARGQLIKPDVEAAPDRESIREACRAHGVPVDAIDEEVREAAKQLDSRLALQRAQIAALEAKAADFWRKFGALSAQIDGLMSPPPARRPGVKPAVSGLTCTAAEDHRLGRFKG